MEGIEGVMLPGGELREPYKWTTKQLLEHFEEFVGDVFKIAHILDGSPYWLRRIFVQQKIICLFSFVV